MIDPSILATMEQAKQNRLNNYNAIKDNLTKGTREMISGLSDNVGKGITKYNRMSEVDNEWDFSPEERNDPVFRAVRQHFIETGDASQLNAYRMAKASEKARMEEKAIRAQEAEKTAKDKLELEYKGLAENTAVNIGKLYDQSIKNGMPNFADISLADKQKVKNDFKKLKEYGYKPDELNYLSDRFKEVTGENIEPQDVVKTPTESVVVDENIETKVEPQKTTLQKKQEQEKVIDDYKQKLDILTRSSENVNIYNKEDVDTWNSQREELKGMAEELGISKDLKIPDRKKYVVPITKEELKEMEELIEEKKKYKGLTMTGQKRLEELQKKSKRGVKRGL